MKDKLICGLCNLPIDKTKEFAEFIHYEKEKLVKGSSYYHIVCFRERMLQHKEVKQMQGITLRMLNNLKERGVLS